jgi:hypothetical protein
MAAWTWMRYSYCWDISVRDLPALPEGVHLGPMPFYIYDAMTDVERARERSARATWPETVLKHRLRERYVRVRGRVRSVSFEQDRYVICEEFEPVISRCWVVSLVNDTDVIEVLLADTSEKPCSEGDEAEFRGRLALTAMWNWDRRPMALDASVGRFHPGSVAGLVVAAMGMFVFALHLRGWLRGRKMSVAVQ